MISDLTKSKSRNEVQFATWRILTPILRDNLIMRGRIGSIKKSNLLSAVLITFLIVFVAFIVLNIFMFGSYKTVWFYAFCTLVGLYEILKSRFFKLDSAFYFGCSILFVGISGFVYTFTNTLDYLSIYLLSSFALASILSFLVCGQKFHLVIFYSLFFVLIFELLYKLNLITYTISIAICLSFLLLLIVIITVSFLCSKK